MADRFTQVIGTGGIGSGVVFLMDSNRALSRDESRLAPLSPAQDYCKQHIILHYIAKALTPDVSVHAIGAVGQDAQGQRLLLMMEEAGIDTRQVHRDDQLPTMYSVCLQYPDKAICNVTTSNSASAALGTAEVDAALAQLPPVGPHTLVVAAPEVPLATRLRLLERTFSSGAFCLASCATDEMSEFVDLGGVHYASLLCFNQEEAEAFAGVSGLNPLALTQACQHKQRLENPEGRLLITLGSAGAIACAGDTQVLIPAFPTEVLGTGGAGDAFVSGIMVGLALGLPFILPGGQATAAHLGAALAAESVRSADTIALHIDKELVHRWVNTLAQGGQAG